MLPVPLGAEDAALLAGDEHPARMRRLVSAVSLVDIGPLDLASGEALGVLEGGRQSVAVVGIARQCLGLQHELAARGTGVGGDDRDLDAELVGRTGFAFADALDLRCMEGIELPAELALALGSDLGGPRERALEGCLDGLAASDLAPDIADQPAKASAQEAHFSMVAVELLGVDITPRHHRRRLGDAQVGLPQPNTVAAGQAVELPDRRYRSLASVGKVMFLGCTVMSIVARAKSLVYRPQFVGHRIEPYAALATG
jgi:hypothetical protein